MISRTLKCLLAVMLLTAAGCRRNDSGDSSSVPQEKRHVELTVWAHGEEHDMITEVCEKLARSDTATRYSFLLDSVSEDEAAQRLLSGAEDAADVFFFSSDDITQLSDSGILMPLDNSRAWIAQNNTAHSISAAEISGKLYGVPCSVDANILYYDRSALSENDVRSLRLILEKDLPDKQYTYAMDLSDGTQMSGFFTAAGCNVTGADDGNGISSEHGLVAGEYMLHLADEPAVIPLCSAAEVRKRFADRSIAAAAAHAESFAEIQSSLGKDFGASVLPMLTMPDGSSAQLGSAAVYRLCGVNAATPYPQEAEQLARMLSDTDIQRRRLERLSMIPVGLELLNDSSLIKQYPAVAAVVSQLECCHTPKTGGFIKHAAELAAELTGDMTLNDLRKKLGRFAQLVLSTK